MQPTDDARAQPSQPREGLTVGVAAATPAPPGPRLWWGLSFRRFHLRLLTELPFGQSSDQAGSNLLLKGLRSTEPWFAQIRYGGSCRNVLEAQGLETF